MIDKPVAFSRAGFRALLIASALMALVIAFGIYALLEWA